MVRLILVTALAALAASTPALAADWVLEPSASRIDFVASFEGNNAPGTFRTFDARARFDPDHPEQGRLDVTVQVGSADMRSADINKAIAGPEWFDSARFPQGEFRSAQITGTGQGRYAARGTLKLKGIERVVVVPFRWFRAGNEARMEGELVVKRNGFDIGTGRWAATNVIGPDVKIRFSVRLRPAG